MLSQGRGFKFLIPNNPCTTPHSAYNLAFKVCEHDKKCEAAHCGTPIYISNLNTPQCKILGGNWWVTFMRVPPITHGT